MSTRGLYGFRKNGIDKVTYNHYDSYPDGLGKEVVRFCANTSLTDLNSIYDHIELVDKRYPPTEEQLEECYAAEKFYPYAKYKENREDWYTITSYFQANDLQAYLDCARQGFKIFMVDRQDFIKDSLLCEYAYIVDLDCNKLEFYVGWQNVPDKFGWYGQGKDESGYYPCKRLMSVPLGELTSVEDVVAQMEKGADADKRAFWASDKYSDQGFSDEQFDIIHLGFENGLTEEQVAVYAKREFSPEQMFVISLAFDPKHCIALEQASYFADPKFNPRQMKEIEVAVLRGLSNEQIEVIANEKFDYEQMQQICCGFEFDGLSVEEVKTYAKPELSVNEMHDARYKLADAKEAAQKKEKDSKKREDDAR